MIITFTNVIGAIRTAFSVVRSGLKMWLGFQTSQTLGAELVSNGDFSDGTTLGWTFVNLTADISNNTLKLTSTTSDNNRAFYNISTEVGKTYQMSADVKSGASNSISGIGGIGTTNPAEFQDGANADSFTTLKFVFTAVLTTTQIRFLNSKSGVWGGLGSIAEFDNVSVKELTQITPDKSGNNNVGELFTGKALEFDGSTEYVDCGDVGANKTLAFWFNPTGDITASTYPSQRLFGFNTSFFGITLGSFTGSLEGETLTIVPDASSRTATSMNFEAGVWYRVVVSWNSTNNYYDIYVNGELKTDLSTGVHTLASWSNFTIGKIVGESMASFDGLMSNVQIYDASLTTSDVTYDYANPNKLAIDNPSTSLNVTNLKAYWALSEGDGLVAYDSGTNLEEEKVQNGTFNLGSEEVVNGDFSDGTNDWATSNSTISIEGGALKITSTGGNRPQANQIVNGLVVGSQYKLSAVAKRGTTANDVEIEISGIASLTTSNRNSTTEYETIFYIFTATATSHTIQAKIDEASEPSGTTAYFDNISVKEVPNWTLGDGWNVTDNKLNVNTDGGNQFAKQLSILEVGKTYVLTLDVSLDVGEIKFESGGTPNFIITTSDTTISHTFVATLTDVIFRRNVIPTRGYISNVSVREITPSDHGGLINGADYVDAQPRIPQLGMMNWSKGSNLFPFSEDFENSDWIKNAGTTITNNYALSPNGTQTASRYLGTGQSGLYDTFTLSANSYTLSFYVKSNTSQTQLCRLVGDSNQVSSNLSVTIDWNRISYTFTASGLANKANGIYRDSNDNDLDILIWGGQLEQSSSVGAYRLTDGAATSNSTVIANPTIPTKDIFGNLVRDRLNSFNLGKFGGARVDDITLSGNQATIQLWFKNVNSNDSLYLADLHSATDRIVLGFNSSQLSVFHEITGAWQNFGTITDGDWNFATFTFDGTNLKCFVGTSQLGVTKTITAINIGTTTDFGIGMNHFLPTRTQDYNGHISDLLIYDRVLTSTEIENNYNAGLSAHTN